MKLTEAEKLDLEFYKNGTAESVLKRFKFSEEEEKLVRDAIRTAQRPNPRMVLIRQADALLKKVAKTRTPISSIEEVNKEKLIRAIANVEMMKDKTHKNHFFTMPKKK